MNYFLSNFKILQFSTIYDFHEIKEQLKTLNAPFKKFNLQDLLGCG